jgi:CDP-paratose 2-epimerase
VRVVVTGGAGFVGANVVVALAGRNPDWQLIAFDNLRRRGSELNLTRIRRAGAVFVHGDVRQPRDLDEVGQADAVVECSAEPSVLAGLESGLDFLVATNLIGAYNCLELARRCGAAFVFLSTSRVYPIGSLNALRLDEAPTRFELAAVQELPGAAVDGISEAFPLDGNRTFYGATKLAAELLITEYVDAFGLRAVVDRCGVIAGPWQMGKVDQGVFTYWLLSHYFGRPLRYLGFGGTGKQVRDLLHVDDLVQLVEEQILASERWRGQIVNVGGGREVSLSLVELTEMCRELTGREVSIERGADDARPGDVPVYLSDCRRLFGQTAWRPRRDARAILADVLEWAREHERGIRDALNFG